MLDKIKRHFMMKWLHEYEKELYELEIIFNDEELDKIRDIRGDLQICEKVLDSYFSIVDAV